MIVFDVEPLQNPDYAGRGIGRYVRSLIDALAQAEGEYALCYNAHLPPPDHNMLPAGLEVVPATALEFSRLQPDWLVTCSPFERSKGATARALRGCVPSAQHAIIAYDLIPLLYAEHYLQTAQARASFALGLNNFREADVILTISESTKNDLESLLGLGSKCQVIGTGVSPFFRETGEEVGTDQAWRDFARRHAFVHKPFLFTVSGAHYTKNLTGLLEAYAGCAPEFRHAHPLVIGGGIDEVTVQTFRQQWREITRAEFELESEPKFIPRVNDAVLRELYRRCTCFVYASRYEGFGLPLAEALESRAVCCTTRSSSLVEIVDNGDFSCSPIDTDALSRLIEQMTESRRKRDDFLAWADGRPPFLWSEVRDRLVSALHAADRPRRTDASSTFRYAVVGPLAPERSGIATYDSALLPEFINSERFDWFTPGGHLAFDGTARQYPLSLLERTINRYHESLYIIGNSFHHVPTLEMLMRHAGVVWLHDVRLNGLAWDYARKLSPTDPLSKVNEWARGYDADYPKITSLPELMQAGCGFARPLLKNARAFIVHSDHARALLRQEFGGMKDRRPIHVVPLALTRGAKQSWHSRPVGEAGLTIGMIGFMAPIRCPEVVIAAAELLKTTFGKVAVSVVGACDPELDVKLRRAANRAGIKLSISGFVEEREFENRVQEADILVQLRRESNGESSATVSMGVELGMPVVTNLASAIEVFGDLVSPADPLAGPGVLADVIRRALSVSASADRLDALQTLKSNSSSAAVFYRISNFLDGLISASTISDQSRPRPVEFAVGQGWAAGTHS